MTKIKIKDTPSAKVYQGELIDYQFFQSPYHATNSYSFVMLLFDKDSKFEQHKVCYCLDEEIRVAPHACRLFADSFYEQIYEYLDSIFVAASVNEVQMQRNLRPRAHSI